MTLRDSTATTATGTDTMNAPWPTVAAHDRAILMFVTDGVSLTVTTPTGFTFVGSLDIISGDDQELFIYERQDCDGTESGNIVIVTPGTGFDKIAVVMTFSGRSNVASLILNTTVQNTAQTPPFTIVANGVTAGAGDDVIAFFAIDPHTGSATWTFSQPAGFIERSDNSIGFTAASTATKEGVPAGPTGTVSSTVTMTSGSDVAGWGTYVIAVPAGAQAPIANDVYDTSDGTFDGDNF